MLGKGRATEYRSIDFISKNIRLLQRDRYALLSNVVCTVNVNDSRRFYKKKETFLEFKFEIPNSRMPLGKNFVSIEITTRCEFRRNVIRISRTHDVCTINDAFINNTLRNNTTFLIYKARMHA